MALTDKLSAIGKAIRDKTGKTDLLTLEQMPTEIAAIETGGGELPEEAFLITGDCSYKFSNNGWNWFVENYGDKVTSQDVTTLTSMFYGSTKLTKIPFEINCKTGVTNHNCNALFRGCYALISLPKINNFIPAENGNMFQECWHIREIPDDYCDSWDWSYQEKQTSAYYAGKGNLFNGCYSLRKFPYALINKANPNSGYSGSYFYSGFTACYTLDELKDLPIPYTSTWTSNGLYGMVNSCYRLKNLTFATPNGQPYVMKWKLQTLDCSPLGYSAVSFSNSSIVDYNSGITADKEVTDDATYQALKNDPDWFTRNIAYSRYNHDSAVATINSLPDTSAYLATAGGTNTIKFKGAAGSATDGGAINTLTEAEIAVATAKGWTVTLT